MKKQKTYVSMVAFDVTTKSYVTSVREFDLSTNYSHHDHITLDMKNGTVKMVPHYRNDGTYINTNMTHDVYNYGSNRNSLEQELYAFECALMGTGYKKVTRQKYTALTK